jgi:Tfp pilus assembly pilus retraction ATPase PilT
MPRKAIERFESKDGADFRLHARGRDAFASMSCASSTAWARCSGPFPRKALTLDELKMPHGGAAAVPRHSGLILVTGKTGSGKSTRSRR